MTPAPGPPKRERKRKRMNTNLLILLALVAVTAVAAFARDPGLPVAGVRAGWRLLGSVWVEIVLGFVLAGLIEVLVSPEQLLRWLGDGHGFRGIAIGWAIGLLLPGGPYLLFPMVASLLGKGAGPGPLITLIAAKTLLSPLRMLTYEAPLLGWPLTLARLLPGLLVPPVLGILGQSLYRIFSSSASAPR
jgi:uncharacterized membrane protein YraQ (UPF0718 family)